LLQTEEVMTIDLGKIRLKNGESHNANDEICKNLLRVKKTLKLTAVLRVRGQNPTRGHLVSCESNFQAEEVTKLCGSQRGGRHWGGPENSKKKTRNLGADNARRRWFAWARPNLHGEDSEETTNDVPGFGEHGRGLLSVVRGSAS